MEAGKDKCDKVILNTFVSIHIHCGYTYLADVVVFIYKCICYDYAYLHFNAMVI